MGVAFALFLAPIILIIYVLFRTLKWIVLGIILWNLILIVIELIIYKICKNRNYFEVEFLERIKGTKYGKYKRIFLLILKNSLKALISFSIIIIFFCIALICFEFN